MALYIQQNITRQTQRHTKVLSVVIWVEFFLLKTRLEVMRMCAVFQSF
jgi:hypothetical protein